MPSNRRSIGKLWTRLFKSSRAELLDRARQEGWKRLDLASYHLGLKFQDKVSQPVSQSRPHFFFEPHQVPELAALIRQRLPETAEQIVRRAERICAHRFDLLGYTDLDYGQEIDWHADRVHDKRAPLKVWYKVRYLDFHGVGDVKVTWELNRHQHLVTLARAYRISGAKHFAEEAFAEWYHWLSKNPYPIGVNWASSLEVGFRSMSWLWMFFLLDGSDVVPETFRLDLWKALAINARHMECYLSTFFSPNTHLLGEAVALFFIGILCPELDGASRWQKLGWKIVLEQAQQQVLADGMHFEQSAYYHVYALDFFLHAALLAMRNDIPIPQSFERTIEKMAEALCALGQAGVVPGFGDDDGGRLFDPIRNRGEHLIDPLATTAVLFGRGEFRAIASELPEESFWLLGPEGVAKFEQLAATPAKLGSFVWPASGICMMSSPSPMQQLFVTGCAPHGAQCTGHAHADSLSIQASMNGRALLIDPGTYEYIGDGPDRNLFRGTGAHNTLRIDGVDQSEPAGPFSWATLANGRVDRWSTGETFDFLSASHDGYLRLPGSPVHRRFIFHRKSRFWLARDRVEGTGKHLLELFWHFAPDLVTQPGPDQRFMTSDKSLGLGVVSLEDHRWIQTAGIGSWSPAYGKKEPAPVLRLESDESLPAEIVTLWLPVFDNHSDLGELTRLHKGERGSAAYGYKTGHEQHRLFFSDGKPWEIDGWSSDAEFLYCQSENDLKEIVLCHGSYVEFEGQRVVSAERLIESIELVQSGTTAKILGPNAGLVRLHG